MEQESKLINAENTPEKNLEYPATITQDHFWRGLKKGKWENLTVEETEKEIHLIVEKQFAAYKPMTPLTAEEALYLELMFIKQIRMVTEKNEKKEALVEDRFIYLEDLNLDIKEMPKELKGLGKETFIDLDKENDRRSLDFLLKYKDLILNNERKMKLLSDPKIWHESWIRYGNTTEGLTFQGIRSLSEYGFEEETFSQITNKIKESTGRDKLRMLDLGGASGRALHQAKEIDPTLEIFNLTIDEEPTMFPVDHFYLIPAERMPDELEEQIDFIVSRTTFRYLMYPDLVLKNLVKALSVGGYADFVFSSERSANKNLRDLEKRVREGLLWIKDLEKKGFLETDIPEEENYAEYMKKKDWPGDFSRFNRGTVGHFHITKKKSLQETLNA